MFSLRGVYAPLTITPTLFLAMGKPHQAAWKKVQEAQKRWSHARDLLPILEASANAAPTADDEEAKMALRSGTPIPVATAPAARQAVIAKQREIDALASLADEAEQSFIAGLREDRTQVAQDARPTVDELGLKVVEQIKEALASLDLLAGVLGVWAWARSEGDTLLPTESRLAVRSNGQERKASELLEVAIDVILQRLPAGIENAEAKWAALNAEIQQRPQTADGLLIDRAAQKEWQR